MGADPEVGLEGGIAVIGMSGRFPGAQDVAAFWSNLRDGVESIRFLSAEELLAGGEREELIDDVNYVAAAAPLDDIDQFDAGFFGMSPRDAAVFDPQHRLFLESAWEAFENAGYVGAELDGSVGVYASCGLSEYMFRNVLANREVRTAVGDWLVRHTGNDTNFLATRVSYELDLHGPSLNVQTACSSTLVAIHLACQSLLNGECDVALAGGAVVMPAQHRGYLYKEGEILSPDGHCRAFDEKAAGTVMSSACAAVLLKPLAAAIEDGDHVSAVILGSAINNDGRAKVGYLAPSVDGQASVITEALAVAGVSARDVSYVEAHGTGTLIGDPIEIAGLTEAFRADTDDVQFCAIGSLKSNIGHTGEASGVASFIKTVLALRHGEIPPSLHYQSPNPQADLPTTPFFVNDELRRWDAGIGGRRIAGVTSLGAGGTNAHLLLAEAPAAAKRTEVERHGEVLVLSARSEAAADDAVARLAAHLRANPDVALVDVAFTLMTGRRQFASRRAVAAVDVADAVASLESGDSRVVRHHHVGDAPSVVFLAPGGGAQYPGMGRGLYETEPVYRAVIDACAARLTALHGLDLLAAMYPDVVDDESTRRLERPGLALPALYATTMAMAELLRSWGVEPAAMIGHSAGEYAAAALAGVFSRDDGLALVALRGQLFERLPAGGMLSVAASADDLADLLAGGLDIAALNTPGQCVLSGPIERIAAAEAALATREIDATRVHIDVAAHSSMLDPILAEFGEFCRTIRFQPPQRPYVSNLTGTWITATEACDPEYWVRHLRGTVRFADGIETVLSAGRRTLVEIGPGRTLAGFAQQATTKAELVTPTLRHPKETAGDGAFALRAVGRVWASGAAVDSSARFAGSEPRRVPLPTYPFERRRYWVDPDPVTSHGAPVDDGVLRKRPDIAEWFATPNWRRSPIPDGETGGEARRWMLVGRRTPLQNQLAQRLRARGHDVFVVGHAASFARKGAGRSVIDLADASQWMQLFDAVRSEFGVPDHIVLTAVDGAPHPRDLRRSALDRYEDTVRHELAGLLGMAQAIASLASPVEVTVVTSGACAVSGPDDVTHPERALLHGALRVIPHELAHVRARVVDVDVSWRSTIRGRERRDLAGTLVHELTSPSVEDVVAYRSSRRWSRHLDDIALPPLTGPAWASSGVVLITGGFGGLGLTVAEAVGREAPGSTLVLVGRTPLPDESTWSTLLAGDHLDPIVRRRLEVVRDLRAAGCTVHCVAADVTDGAELAGLTRFGRIDTVVHTAGVLQDALIAFRSGDVESPVIATKARGLLVLDEVLRREPPRRWVLFSSVSSLIGLPGQFDYSAANAFLDAFAAAIEARGDSHATVVNWNAWQQVGMAVRAAADEPTFAPPRAAGATTGQLLESMDEDGQRVLASTVLERDRDWLLGEHVINGGPAVVPGTGYLELMREVATNGSDGPVELRDVVFAAPFVVGEHGSRALHVRLDRPGGLLEVYSESPQQPNVTARTVEPEEDAAAPVHDLAAARRRCTRRSATFDGYLDQPFVDFGPRWGALRRIDYGVDEAVVTTSMPTQFVQELEALWLHPGLLDVATGSAQALVPGFEPLSTFLVPFTYDSVLVRGPLPAEAVSIVTLRPGSTLEVATFDVSICQLDGTEVVRVEGYTMRRAAGELAAGLQADAPAVPSRRTSPIDDALRVGMTPDEGAEALRRLLVADIGVQVIASSVNVRNWIASVDTQARLLEVGADDDATGMFDRPDISVEFEAPATPIEAELAKVWRELLGVDRVGRNDDFFELGGQSLVAVRLFAWIRKQYQVDMPLVTLFEAPTIAQCAKVIAAHLGIVDAPLDAASEPADGSGETPAHGAPPADFMSIAAGAAILPEPVAARSLIPISSAGRGRPLFIVHGAGGNILFLWSLARALAGDRPVYGFQAMGVNASDVPDQTIEEMAGRYVRELLAEHEGPFLLGGYSGGGSVTLEMVRQLQAVGEHVDNVLLFDSVPTFAPDEMPSRLRRARNLVENLRKDGLAAVAPRYSADKITRYLSRKLPFLPVQSASVPNTAVADWALGWDYVDGYVDLYDHFTAVARRYEVGTYDVDVTIFKAAQIAPILPHDYFWGEHLRGAIAMRRVPGTHQTMFYPEFSRALAQQIREALDEVESRTGS